MLQDVHVVTELQKCQSRVGTPRMPAVTVRELFLDGAASILQMQCGQIEITKYIFVLCDMTICAALVP